MGSTPPPLFEKVYIFKNPFLTHLLNACAVPTCRARLPLLPSLLQPCTGSHPVITMSSTAYIPLSLTDWLYYGSTVHSVHCTVHRTLYTVHCAIYTVHCQWYTKDPCVTYLWHHLPPHFPFLMSHISSLSISISFSSSTIAPAHFTYLTDPVWPGLFYKHLCDSLISSLYFLTK